MEQQLPRLQARISNLHALRDLVRALRALAASRVQEAQSALGGIRGFVEIVEDAIGEGAALLPDSDGSGRDPRGRDVDTLIVVCSEHGFAGGFNERVLDRAEAERGNGRRLGVIGRRGAALADERGLAPDWSLPMATHVGGVLGITRRVADRLADVTVADIVYCAYRRGGQYEVVTKSILPLAPSLLARPAGRSAPLHHLPAPLLLERLASEYLFAEITSAVMESLASENGARLHAMEAADHNIGDKLDALHRTERALRQDAITSELLDVVAGTEAVLAGRSSSPGA